MNILRIAYEWPPPWIGLVPHIYELTASQAKRGHKITVMCGRWPRSGDQETLENVNLISFFREPIKGTLNITTSVLLFFKYLMWRRSNKPDVIHSHGHFAIWIYLYRKILKGFRPHSEELSIPLVVHFHNTVRGRWNKLLEMGDEPKPITKFLEWPLAEKADIWAVGVADACIFVTEEVRAEAIKHYSADPETCFVIGTAVNVDRFKPVGQEEVEKSRKDLGLDMFDKVILNLGMMVPRKNIELLVETLSHLPVQYKLLLVGEDDSDYMYEVMRTATNLHVEDRIIRVGYTPYPQVPIAYQLSDIFVLPSRYEGFPKVIFESLACGTPALVSAAKLNENFEGLHYITNFEPTALANEIQFILDLNTNIDTKKVGMFFSWDTRAQMVEDIYNKIVSDE